MNGGYLLVSLQNHDFVVDGGRVYVKDIYKTIADSNYKAVMLCDITLNGERKQNIYSLIERKENSVILYAYGNAITITDTDTIEITGDIVNNIRYYNSLDEVPADLPDGSFVAVPSAESGGGGLTVVELSAIPNAGETITLSETESTALATAAASLTPFVVKVTGEYQVYSLLFMVMEMPNYGVYACTAVYGLGTTVLSYTLTNENDNSAWDFGSTIIHAGDA